MTIRIIDWDDLTEEQRREWVKYRVQLTMEGGGTLYDMARRLRIETAYRLELRDPTPLPVAPATGCNCRGLAHNHVWGIEGCLRP